MSYANMYGAPQVDFRGLGTLADSFQQGQQFGRQRRIDNARQSTLSQIAVNPDGMINYADAATKLYQAGDIEGATTLSRMAENQARDRENLAYKREYLDVMRQQANARSASASIKPAFNAPSGYYANDPQNPAAGVSPIPGYKAQTAQTTARPPSGYLWNDPNNPEAGVRPIPGGPGEKVDAEIAARLGLGRSFLEQLPKIKEGVDAGNATGLYDYASGAFGSGKAGELHRQIASGADALLRNLTGAGMSVSEAEQYANRYRPTWRDDSSTLRSKLDQLETELKTIMDTVGRGRGGSLAPQPATPDKAALEAELRRRGLLK